RKQSYREAAVCRGGQPSDRARRAARARGLPGVAWPVASTFRQRSEVSAALNQRIPTRARWPFCRLRKPRIRSRYTPQLLKQSRLTSRTRPIPGTREATGGHLAKKIENPLGNLARVFALTCGW